MKEDTIQNFSHHFLIAMPSLIDPLFRGAVVYIYDHDEQGTMAFVINKPMQITVGDVLRQLALEIEDESVNDRLILQGGPVAKEQLYIMQYGDPEAPHPFTLSNPQEVMQMLAKGEQKDNLLAFLGYTGWTPGQLESEIKNNDWLICPASREIMFDTPVEKRFEKSIQSLGIDWNQLTSMSGNV
ncbi:MAG: YqgE/AlgH family protein [Gammaproteobacteria bacterium]